MNATRAGKSALLQDWLPFHYPSSVQVCKASKLCRKCPRLNWRETAPLWVVEHYTIFARCHPPQAEQTLRQKHLLQPKLGLPINHALRAGFTLEEIFNLTKIDRWFLVQIKEIVDFEEELAGAKN